MVFQIMSILRKGILNNLLPIFQFVGRVTADPNLKRFTSSPSSSEKVWSVKLFSTEDITFTTAAEKQQAELIIDRSLPTCLTPDFEKQVLDSHGSMSLLCDEPVNYRDRPYFKVNVELTRPKAAEQESNSVAIVLIPVGEEITREVVRTAFQKSIRSKKKAVIV